MPLTGQAKTDYQREYMRKLRSNKRSNVMPESVRPVMAKPVRPKPELVRPAGLSDNQWEYMKFKAEQKQKVDRAEDIAGSPNAGRNHVY